MKLLAMTKEQIRGRAWKPMGKARLQLEQLDLARARSWINFRLSQNLWLSQNQGP